MERDTHFVLGVYEDEDVLLDAVKQVRSSGVKIHEVYSPYPVHGLEHVLGYKRSRLPIAAFLFGMLGTSLALTMQFYMMKFDWPMIIGGKDYAAFPDFIPVSFEMTVLLAAFGMVGVFMVSSNLKPWAQPRIFDVRITDDKHVMAIDIANNSAMDQEKIKEILKSSGATEVNNKSFDE
ncbi:DUF3341 domain-containing protein [Algoriphagus sp. NF]|jgi:Protein of unknown function (DUF3341).|uniref:DUF3341 domain-containing protein n=2 Tax=Algoriphagus TaxID=246875 RepID=A0ABS7N977_9BACT|nr:MULTISPECIES: DUF3341 domain-containing protein [Algoriphagus]MBY5952890.1 DUF3341 domain-containing protein [Algoriphagus marincola]MDE0560641.1 DUF3341 domain-containing protein [Algoriphagus sp. NF]TDK49560.1 DUF3341 domain-containing protein [Algoriphagus aquimaris]